jgi:hypothetical protein
VNGDAPGVSVTGGAPVRVVAPSAPVQVTAPSVAPVIIEVCKQGPAGPPGSTPDLVCVVKPDSTLTYMGNRLTRVDYVDGRYKTLAYSGNKLITVACVDPGAPQTVTKTLGYTGNRLTSVTTVVT